MRSSSLAAWRMHFAWAVMFGVYFLRCRNSAAKAFGVFYPALMLSAIVATANHYVIDAIAEGLVILAAFLVMELHLWQRVVRLGNSLMFPQGTALPRMKVRH